MWMFFKANSKIFLKLWNWVKECLSTVENFETTLLWNITFNQIAAKELVSSYSLDQPNQARWQFNLKVTFKTFKFHLKYYRYIIFYQVTLFLGKLSTCIKEKYLFHCSIFKGQKVKNSIKIQQQKWVENIREKDIHLHVLTENNDYITWEKKDYKIFKNAFIHFIFGRKKRTLKNSPKMLIFRLVGFQVT